MIKTKWSEFILLSCCAMFATAPVPVGAQTNSEIAQQYLDSLYAFDFSALETSLHPDAIFEDPTAVAFAGESWLVEGRDAIIDFFRESSAGVVDSGFRILSVFSTGDFVVFTLEYWSNVEGEALGVPGGQLMIEVAGVTVLRVQDGQVIHHVDHIDYDSLLRQIAQQRANTSFQPEIESPLFAAGDGGSVIIDEGHNNFHTKNGRYRPFALLLEADGYTVDSHIGAFTTESLSGADTVVISNALHSVNATNWELPTPSAFTDSEIQNIVDFVDAGGGLFLIADHMPMPGATAALAARFGIEFSNGFVFEICEDNQLSRTPSIFKKSEGRIGDHPITRGRHEAEAIIQVASFTGSAFPATDGAVSLIRFGEKTTMLLPSVAWEFDANTSSKTVSGWSQGVAIEYGDGRVVIFGEAAMFTSQVSAQNSRFGMTSSQADDNQQLLLNIVHWLSHSL